MQNEAVCNRVLLLIAACLMGGAAAADQAQNEDCGVYYFGIGQRRDVQRAFACEMARPERGRNWVLIAVMYLNGEGTERDVGKAREALEHMRPEECGVTCAALDEVLRRHEANPNKRHRRIDYCKQIAQTTPDVNYCEGVEERKEEFRRKREEKAVLARLAPEARKRFAGLSQAYAKLKEADSSREYMNFREGTIRGEAAAIMVKRVLRHYEAALAAWGPQAVGTPPLARPLADADKELNDVYRRIMADRDAEIAEAQATQDTNLRETRVADAKSVKSATRDAERAWLRYAEAWKKLVASLRPDDPAVLDSLRAFLTEQRIRELKYSSIGDSSTTDPEEAED
jgi:hypothetical protein